MLQHVLASYKRKLNVTCVSKPVEKHKSNLRFLFDHLPSYLSRAVWLNNIMVAALILLCGSIGLLIYAKYHQCDPMRAKLISRSDQVNLYGLKKFSHFQCSSIPCISWTFSSTCQVSQGFLLPVCWVVRWGTLSRLNFFHSLTNQCFSSVSSGINSIAAVIVEDIWKRLVPTRPLSDEFQATISKYLCKLGRRFPWFPTPFSLSQQPLYWVSWRSDSLLSCHIYRVCWW